MVCDCPVVASEIETLREGVGDPGLFADVSSENRFASAIVELLNDDDPRYSLGAKFREREKNGIV